MEIEYRRTAQGSFMLLEGQEDPDGFEKKMLTQNDIPGLLSFHTLQINGRTQFWYDMSGMRSFRDMITSEGVNTELLYGLFSAVEEGFRGTAKYLIDEEKLIMYPDTLFFSKTKGRFVAGLCYCPMPHDGSQEQLRELMRFLISEVDHSKGDITALCYELFSITEGTDFSFYDLMKRVREEYGGSETDIMMERAGIFPAADMFTEQPGTYEIEEEETWEAETEDEADAPSVKERLRGFLKARIMELLPDFLTGKERLLPEKKKFRDIQFDEVPAAEEKTVLLSEDMMGCRGKLIYESGGRGGCDLDVKRSPFSIGSRQGGNDAVLSSDAVSRYHARIILRDGSFFLEDLNSKNGTFVNGVILPYHEQRKLNRMDVISFADVVYRVV